MNIFQGRSRKDPLRIIFEEPTSTLAETYHEASKINEANGLSFRRRIGTVLGSPFYLKLISRGYKSYPVAETTPLPALDQLEDTDLSRAFKRIVLRRRSVREFTGAPMSLNNLTNIIFNACGITGIMTLTFGIEQKARAVPSGGALYPLELYVVSHRVEGLAPGVYHYNVEKHALELLTSGQFDKELGYALFYEEMFKSVSAALIITGVLKRSSLKYGERAYRFMLLEAGHVGQNICMTAGSLGLGCVMLGGFFDDNVNQLVGVNGVTEAALYTCALGSME